MLRSRVLAVVAAFAAIAPFQASSEAAIISYFAALSGPAEDPSNTSPGPGSASIDIDTVANTMRVRAIFGNLQGTTTASHIHAATANPGTGTAGVATQVPTFVGFPLGVTGGNYDMTFDLLASSTYNPAYVTANGGTAASAESALLAALASGKAYYNIHTTAFPGGEIRGFLTPLAPRVPEPSTLVLMGLGGTIVAAARVRRLRAAGA